MARLRNRIRKSDYFSDGELLRWPRDKRTTYSGLYALAEDSGCLEDDCFTWKLLLWPSPLDADITVELLEQWRDEMVAAGKLIPYAVAGVRYLYLRSFHKHEHPRNPQRNSIPLPPWVSFIEADAKYRGGTYSVSESDVPDAKDGVYRNCTESIEHPPPRPVPSRPVQSLKALADADAPAGVDNSRSVADSYADDFIEWWTAYGKVGSKADAERLYRFWRSKGAERADLLAAAQVYRVHCERTDCKMQHARTFLAKPQKGSRARWYEWADGEEHGGMDVGASRNLSDVLTAGAEAFGLTGGTGDNGSGTALGQRRSTRAAGRGQDARRSLPTGELEG